MKPLPDVATGGHAWDWRRTREQLFERCLSLNERLHSSSHDETTWSEYIRTLDVLLRVEEQVARHKTTEPVVYTTAQMAQRLGVTVRTLLAWKRAGVVRPSIAKGKRLRWQLSDALR